MKYVRVSPVALLLALGLVFPQFAQAPQVNVSESVAASGGGSMANTIYIADVTVGQPLTHVSDTVSAGFWYAKEAEETELPKISITPAGLSFSATANDANPDGQELSIINTGDGILRWTIAGSKEWLSLSSESGECNSGEAVKVTVSIDISNLTDGTHKAIITVSALDISPQSVEVILELTPVRAVNPGDKQSVSLGELKYNGEGGMSVDIPSQTTLGQNYPNPSNPETWIPYQLTESADVTIRIYSTTNQIVRTLHLGHKPAGFYTDKARATYWDGRNETGEQVTSGIYFYSIQAGEYVDTRKMLVRR